MYSIDSVLSIAFLNKPCPCARGRSGSVCSPGQCDCQHESCVAGERDKLTTDQFLPRLVKLYESCRTTRSRGRQVGPRRHHNESDSLGSDIQLEWYLVSGRELHTSARRR